MSDRIDKSELINRVAEQTGQDPTLASSIIEAALEEMVTVFKQGQGVTLRNFGTFYVRPERNGTVFKFTPSQRLRKIFGWSSTYKGEV